MDLQEKMVDTIRGEPNFDVKTPPPNEVNKNPLVEKLWDALESMTGREGVDHDRRQRQLRILNRLPQDFDTEIKGLATYHGLRANTYHTKQVVDATIFEQLVKSDGNICPNGETEISKTLRSIMENPGRFKLQELGMAETGVAPDILITDNQNNVIYGIEVKLRSINEGLIRQIQRSKWDLNSVINFLKRTEDSGLVNHGLEMIAKHKQGIGISNDFKVILAVSFGAYDGNIESLVTPNLRERKDFMTGAKRILGRTTIVESPFSRDEVGVLGDAILNTPQTS